MRSLVLLLFAVSVWVLPGYFPQVVLRNDSEGGTFPEERILGFAVLSMSCLVSLRYFGDPIWGAVFGTVVAWGAAIFAWRCRKVKIGWPQLDLSWRSLIKVVFFLAITAVYLPLLWGWRLDYRLPDVYDLPKHLAAVSSIAHASRWPAPNPFAPNLSFAYNLLFYMPAGVLTKLAGWPAATGMFFSASLLWLVWNMVGLFERVTLALGGQSNHRLIAILLGTVVSGYTGLLRATDSPMSFDVAFWHLSAQYFDDPLTIFAYVPQHMLCVACLMAIVCLAQSRTLTPLRASMAAAVLLAGGMLSSAVLTPILLAAAVPILVLVSWSEKTPLRGAIGTAAAGGAVLLAIAGPFLLEYIAWYRTGLRPHIQLVHANFLYTFLSFGPVSILALVGFIRRFTAKDRGRGWDLYVVICGLLILFWLVVSLPELQLKTAEAIRLMFIPAAAFGFVWVWHLTRGFWIAQFAIAIAVFVLPATATLLETAYLASGAYLPRAPGEEVLLEAVDRLPSNAIIGLQQPNQFLAASLGGRMTVMDFRGYQKDAYLPATQRSSYAELVDSLQRTDSATVFVPDFTDALIVPASSFGAPLWASLCGASATAVGPTYLLLDLKGCGPRGIRHPRLGPVITLEAMSWIRWGILPSGSKDDPVTRTVSSPTEGDFGLLAPMHLDPGEYRIRVKIAGVITGPPQGAAHISLHGKEKVINIQPGDYQQGKDFTGYFSQPRGFDGSLSFGLGGWSRGAGWIRLNALTIERVSAE